jgi:hypothetical protein
MWTGLGKKTVYLAGPINGCSDWEANGWRAEAKRWLSDFNICDPMDRDYRGKEEEHVNEIIHSDKKDILACEKILVMAARPSWGTAMEIHFCWINKKLVYAVVPDGVPVSPWLRFHVHAIYPTLRDACLAIADSPLEVRTR